MDTSTLKSVTITNLVFLSLRHIFIQLFTTLGFFLLTIILNSSQIGLFAIVSEIVGILGYFSDIGLASALIQKKSAPTPRELHSVFSFQQVLVLSSSVILLLLYPILYGHQNPSSAVYILFVSLLFSFIIASLKTIPSILLERNLNFRLISTVDVIENVTFYLVTVVFAYLGFGELSYAFGVICRSLLGLIIIYSYSDYRPRFSFDFSVLKPLLLFGLPFQLNTFIALAKDRFSNLAVAAIIGTQGFGYIAWATKAARLPLGFMDALMRISFPTFSRIQENKELLRRSLERSTTILTMIIFPILSGISVIAFDFINIVPKYLKWQPALLPLYLYCFGFALASVTTPLTAAFNSVGKIKLNTYFMIMWTVLTWIFYPLFSIRFGFLGTAYAAFIVNLSSFVVWYFAHRHFGVNVFKSILIPSIGSVLIIISSYLVSLLSLSFGYSLFSKVIVSVAIYAATILLLAPDQLGWLLKSLNFTRAKK